MRVIVGRFSLGLERRKVAIVPENLDMVFCIMMHRIGLKLRSSRNAVLSTPTVSSSIFNKMRQAGVS